MCKKNKEGNGFAELDRKLTREALIKTVFSNVEVMNKSADVIFDRVKYTRPYSWDLCYGYFKKNGRKFFGQENATTEDWDQAALELSSYLGSFGMYSRGSAIMSMSRKFLVELLQEIFEALKARAITYEDVYEECTIIDPKNLTKLFGDVKDICRNNLRDRGYTGEKNATNLLVSKILLGTVGVMPAYDTHLTKSIACCYSITYGDKNTKGPKKDKKWAKLVRMASDKDLQRFLKEKFNGLLWPYVADIENKKDYPVMRLLDLYLWAWGINNPKEKDSPKDDRRSSEAR